MRKLLLAAAATAALAFSPAAQAAVTVDACTMVCDGPAVVGTDTTISYSEAGLETPTFIESVTFTNTLAGLYSITVDTSSRNVDFTDISLTGPGGPFSLSENFDNGVVEFWSLSNLALAAGQYTLSINGNNSQTGSLGGTITISQAVPEPGTWAMMLLGFGGIGFSMRRARRTTAIPQIA